MRTSSERSLSQLLGARGLTTITGVTILASGNQKKTPIWVSVTSCKLTQDRKERLRRSNSGSYGVALFQGLLLPLLLAASGFSLSLAKQRDEYSNIQTFKSLKKMALGQFLAHLSSGPGGERLFNHLSDFHLCRGFVFQSPLSH